MVTVEGTYRLAMQAPSPHYAEVRVTIEPITSRGDVMYAAARAVWEALGRTPVRSPSIAGSDVSFPDL